MPIIRVEMFKGRTQDQKRNLVKELTEAFNRTCGDNHQGIDVMLFDIEKDNWGSGGVLFSEKK